MEKKFKANNGLGNLLWIIVALFLLGVIIFRFIDSQSFWFDIIYFVFAILFILSTTIKEYVITELNFIEIHFVLWLFSKKKRIPIGDIVGLKKLKNNQLQLDLVRGFEILRVNKSDIDLLIAELKERNPRIKVVGEED